MCRKVFTSEAMKLSTTSLSPYYYDKRNVMVPSVL